MKIKSLFTIIILFLFHGSCINSAKVAIIGAGVAGAISAYYLKMLKGNSNIQIDIYEHIPQQYDLCLGFLIHSKNQYANELVKKLKLKMGPMYPSDGPKPVIFNGLYYHPLDMNTKFKTAFDLLKPIRDDVIQKFQKIYDRQKEETTFETVAELLNSLDPDFNEYAKKSISEILEKKLGGKEALKNAENLVKATLAHYTMINMNANGFYGLMMITFSAILEEIQQSMQDAKNEKIILDLIKISEAELVYRKVLKITPKNVGYGYYVTSKERKSKPEDVDYDFVIMATNATKNIDFDKKIKKPKFVQYTDRYFHYAKGKLTKNCLGVRQEQHVEDIPCLIDTKGLNLVAKLPPEKGADYYIFGPKKLSTREIEQFIDPLRSARFKIQTISWSPNYYDFKLLDDVRFVLADNLYNVRAIDSACLGVEMLAISAKNIALLIRKKCDEQASNAKLGASSSRKDAEQTSTRKSVTIVSDSTNVKCNPKCIPKKFGNSGVGKSKSQTKPN